MMGTVYNHGSIGMHGNWLYWYARQLALLVCTATGSIGMHGNWLYWYARQQEKYKRRSQMLFELL